MAFTAQYAYIDVTLTNYAATAVPIGPITITDPSFNQTNNCGASLPAQSVCTITVQSSGATINNPSGAAYLYAGSLTIGEGAAGAQTIALSSANIYMLTPTAAADFPKLPVNQSSTNLTYDYTFFHASIITSGTVTGLNASDFTFGGYLQGPTTNVGALYFLFTPSAAGTRTAHFTIDKQGQYFVLTGIGYVGPAAGSGQALRFAQDDVVQRESYSHGELL